jgi:ribose transport system ATP-binding protein
MMSAPEDSNSDPSSTQIPRLVMENISKEFPGVKALNRVDFSVLPGEIMGLVGENGAGKSTLVKILSGAYQQDEGEIYLDGNKMDINIPADALDLGIRVIYQEIDLVPDLSVKENIFMGQMPTSQGFLQLRKMREETKQIMSEIGFNIDPDHELGSLSLARQHIVAIGQALSSPVQILVFDEPSAVIPQKDMGSLYELLDKLAQKGISIIYISHRLEEILDITDRITILKDGELVSVVDSSQTNEQDLTRLMVGRDLEDYYPEGESQASDQVLKINGLSTDEPGIQNLSNINLILHKGEILGIYGLVGSGRTELAKTIFGVLPQSAGSVFIDNMQVTVRSPQQAIAQGIGLLVEDRKDEGLVLDANVSANITMANYPGISNLGWIFSNREYEISQSFVDKLNIKTPLLTTITRSLSGGNQQKLVLAKWLFRDARILIFDEPTRGIDVGAKAEIYQLMKELVSRGVGIIMISAELNEILGMSDRIIVMRNGQIAGEVDGNDANEEQLVSIAMGVVNDDSIN